MRPCYWPFEASILCIQNAAPSDSPVDNHRKYRYNRIPKKHPNMAVSEHQRNSPAVPTATTPSTAQATPVPNPPQHPPSSTAQLQPSNPVQQTTTSAPQTQGQVTATPAPPVTASTIRELRPRPVSQVTSGRTPATPNGSGNTAAPQRASASQRSQTSRHRTANTTRVTQSTPRRSRRLARTSQGGVLRAGTSHGRRRRRSGAPSPEVRRRRRDWAAPSSPSVHGMVTRSRGRVTRTFQQMEAQAERAIRRANWRRWGTRLERERRRFGEGKRVRVQQVMNPTRN